jgi:hypothetical protein
LGGCTSFHQLRHSKSSWSKAAAKAGETTNPIENNIKHDSNHDAAMNTFKKLGYVIRSLDIKPATLEPEGVPHSKERTFHYGPHAPSFQQSSKRLRNKSSSEARQYLEGQMDKVDATLRRLTSCPRAASLDSYLYDASLDLNTVDVLQPKVDTPRHVRSASIPKGP